MFGLDPDIQVKQISFFSPWIPVSIPRLRLGHENDRKFFCKPRNCRGGGKTRRVLEPPAVPATSPFNPLMLSKNATPRTSFLHLKRRAKVSFFTLLLIYYLSRSFQSLSESYAEILFWHFSQRDFQDFFDI